MIDWGRQPEMNDDEVLRTLFAHRLADEPLPPAVLERVTHSVLTEVQQNLVPAALPPVSRSATLLVRLERFRSWLGSLPPNQTLLLAGAAAVAAMVLIIGVSRITPRPLTAIAEVAGGNATVLSHHTSKFHVQKDGDVLKLRQGDQVLTAEGAVRLTHFPDQVAIIEPGAYIELTRLDEAGGGHQLALTLHDGIVHSQINTPLQANDEYVIRTPGVAVSAVGTDFTVEAVSPQETIVKTMAGQVQVTMGEQVVTVGPGQEVDAVLGQTLKLQSDGD